jgi:hypothetical protein
MCFFLKSIDV